LSPTTTIFIEILELVAAMLLFAGIALTIARQRRDEHDNG
jgi:hypothetical protein